MRDVLTCGKFSTNQGAALRMAALSGAGIVLQWSYRPVQMYLIYVPNRRPTAMLRTVIDFLVERFG